MAKLTAMKGRYLMLFVANQYLPLATTCSLSESVSMIDTETKDDSIYKQLDPESKEWSIDFECQLDMGSTTLKTLHDLYAGNTKSSVIFGKTGNHSDAELPTEGWAAPSGSDCNALKGDAYLSTLKVSGNVQGKATISGTFTGTGALSYVTA